MNLHFRTCPLSFAALARGALACAALAMLALAPIGARAEDAIVVASTTSLQDSGLYDYLLPIFTRKTGIVVKVVARGTGQALDTGRRGDADVVFVHAEKAELQFVADGDGVKRYPVMYDDFVLIGPASDPAGINGETDVVKAFKALYAKRATFISRGDRSGTHIAELDFWKDAGVDVEAGKGSWYRPIGQGMGAALNVASAADAYVLSDRPSWLNFGNKGNLKILVQGDPRLFNQYSVILVNPKTHPQVKQELGMRFIEFLVSPQGQSAIGSYKIQDQQAFHPDANGAFP
jgi:tungstate transport system substrate-binding protein